MAMKSSVKSQNLSILLTDMQGYTDTSSFSSREEIIGLIRRHNQLMLPIIDFYGGKVIKSIGDALLCTFASATDAVVCAIVIQLLLKEYNAKQPAEEKRLNLRVVINTGDVSLEKNDIFGEAVNVTARMEGLDCFPGGTIGISEATYLLMNRNEIAAEKIGPQILKGIPEPVTVYRVPLEKQKLDRLPARLLQLVEKVASGGEAGLADLLKDWSGSVQNLLGEANLGDGISRLGDAIAKKGGALGQNLGQNLGQAQKKVAAALTQKTVLETKRGALEDAPLPARAKSFLIDFAIVVLITLVLVYGWRLAAWALWGVDCVEKTEQLTYQQEKDFNKLGWKLTLDASAGKSYYLRPKGLAESLLGLLFGYPVLFVYAYFFVFWWLRGATPGQAAAGTAVVDGSGGKPGLAVAAKRAAIFLGCVLPVGIGCAPLLAGNPAPYDSACGTRVVA